MVQKQQPMPQQAASKEFVAQLQRPLPQSAQQAVAQAVKLGEEMLASQRALPLVSEDYSLHDKLQQQLAAIQRAVEQAQLAPRQAGVSEDCSLGDDLEEECFPDDFSRRMTAAFGTLMNVAEELKLVAAACSEATALISAEGDRIDRLLADNAMALQALVDSGGLLAADG